MDYNVNSNAIRHMGGSEIQKHLFDILSSYNDKKAVAAEAHNTRLDILYFGSPILRIDGEQTGIYYVVGDMLYKVGAARITAGIGDDEDMSILGNE